ncbi:MAG: rhodanese-like domain-containing protein [Candidatus Pacebacteria bacterium]|nr:rhodanese-like domain-containing protein [Candidatus Paceibacterota bacterium]
MKEYVVILFYKFGSLSNLETVAEAHREKCTELSLSGRMLLAEEGVNATFEGTRGAIDAYKAFLRSEPFFSDILVKESAGDGKAFPKLKIKIRSEVITLGAGTFDVKNETAPALPSAELEKWYEDQEDFVVLDLRNDYEIASGKFDKTIDPGLSNFRDLPKKLGKLADLKDKKVVTVCTGGIRCEKATCLLKREGFKNVYQLKDGIHTYMQEYPGKHFKGTLFVFDNRMTTDVAPTEKKITIGECFSCGAQTENYCSDTRLRPSPKLLCCEECFKECKEYLRKAVAEKDMVH